MRRRMIYDLRPVLIHYLTDPAGISYRADKHHQIQILIFPKKLLLDFISVILIDIKNDQLTGLSTRYLPAQFTSNRASSASHHNPASS